MRRASWAVFSDVHFKGGAILKDVVRCTDWLCEQMRARQVDRILCLGDVFDNPSSLNVHVLSCASRFFDRLADLGKPVHVLTGNHDLHFKHTKSVSSLDVLEIGSLKDLMQVHRKPEILDLDGTTCVVLPWNDDHDELRAVLKRIDLDSRQNYIVLGHAAMSGAKLQPHVEFKPHNASRDCLHASDLAGFKLALFGHFHHPQILGPNAFYVGAPLQHHFGDSFSTQRGLVFVDTQKLRDAVVEPVQKTVDSPLGFFSGLEFQEYKDGITFKTYQFSRFVEKDSLVISPRDESQVSGQRIRVYTSATTSNSLKKALAKEMKSCGAVDVQFVRSIEKKKVVGLDSHVRKTKKDMSLAEQFEAFVRNEYADDPILASLIREGTSLLTTSSSDPSFRTNLSFDGKLETIEIQNFLSIRNPVVVSIKDMDPGIIFLKGPNGAGKSTIFEAVFWCLFGSTIRSDTFAADVINAGSKGATSVELTFANGVSIERIRRKSGSSEIFIRKNGELQEDLIQRSNKSIVQQDVDQYFGVNSDSFLRAYVFGNQTNFSSFLHDSPNRRCEVIESLTGLRVFDSSLVIVNQKLSSVKSHIADLERAINLNADELFRLQDSLESLNVAVLKANAKIHEGKVKLEKRVSEDEESVKKLKQVEDDLSRIRKWQLEDEIAIRELKGVHSRVIEDIGNAKRTKESLVTENRCSKCGQVIPKGNVELELDKIDHDVESWRINLKVVQEKVEVLERRQISLTASKRHLETEQKVLSKVLLVKKEREDLVSEIAREEGIVTFLSKEIEDLTSSMSRIKSRLEVDRTSLKEHESNYNVFKILSTCFARTALKSSTDSLSNFRMICLQEVIQELNAHLNQFVEDLSSDESDSQATVFVTPTLHMGGNFGRLSAGQRQRNYIALACALNLMDRHHMGFSGNFLFFDEVFDSLDASGQQKVLQLLPSLDVSYIWVVTHSESLPLDIPGRIVEVELTPQGSVYHNLPSVGL